MSRKSLLDTFHKSMNELDEQDHEAPGNGDDIQSRYTEFSPPSTSSLRSPSYSSSAPQSRGNHGSGGGGGGNGGRDQQRYGDDSFPGEPEDRDRDNDASSQLSYQPAPAPKNKKRSSAPRSGSGGSDHGGENSIAKAAPKKGGLGAMFSGPGAKKWIYIVVGAVLLLLILGYFGYKFIAGKLDGGGGKGKGEGKSNPGSDLANLPDATKDYLTKLYGKASYLNAPLAPTEHPVNPGPQLPPGVEAAQQPQPPSQADIASATGFTPE